MYEARSATIDFVPRAHRQRKAFAESLLPRNHETWNAISWNTAAGNALNQNYLKQLLRDWGDWVDRAAIHTGYPTESSICAAKEPLNTHVSLQWQLPGGGSYRYALPSRHAILCLEMPQRIIPIHQAILTLDEEPRAVLALWYAFALHLVKVPGEDPKLEGKPMLWELEEKAAYVGMTYNALQLRASRARAKLMKIFNSPVARATEKVLQIITVE